MEPYERQPGETAKAFRAFTIYRDMGPGRSIRNVLKAVDKPDSYRPVLERWSSQNRWVDRAAAWDDYLDQQARQAQVDALKEMYERHIQAAVAMQAKALKRLRGLSPDELSPMQVRLFLIEAAKLERMGRGEPESIVAERRELDIERDFDILRSMANDPEFVEAIQRAAAEMEEAGNRAGAPRPLDRPGDGGETVD